jgi:sortase A
MPDEAESESRSEPAQTWRRRSVRIFGTVLLVAGAAIVAWTLLVWQWQEPFTSLYTKLKQHQLAASYERQVADFIPRPAPPPKAKRRPSAAQVRAAELAALRLTAGRYRVHARVGAAIGRIRVPRLSLNMILVNGTDHDSLKRGPGRDLHSYMPGEGQLVYVAGHRTTYLAPFAKIDELRRGDPVTIETPYATFRYRITRHIIVKADAIHVLRSPGYELLALQACHPRFFATHRYIAYAIPVRVIPRGGRPLTFNSHESFRTIG